jgi:1,4-alpha-glucan branching enzyme
MQQRHIRSSAPARRAPLVRTKQRPEEEKPVDFHLHFPGAKSAAVAGSFNGWDLKRNPLQKDGDEGWKATLWLPTGRHEYRFVVDGAQWCSDPGAREAVPNEFGSTNSVVFV